MTPIEPDALISLKPKHAENILCGKKKVELRTRSVRIKPGARLWIYATLPRAEIVGFAIVKNVVVDSPVNVWRKFGAQACIDEKEFDQYTKNDAKISAIVLGAVTELRNSVSLERIRSKIRNFHPPQFFIRVPPHSRLAELLEASKSGIRVAEAA